MPVCAHECDRDEREGSLLFHRKRVHRKRVHRTNPCIVSCSGMLSKGSGRTIRMSTQPLGRQPPSREVTPGFGECIHGDLTIICLRLGSRVHSCASLDSETCTCIMSLDHSPPSDFSCRESKRATFLAVKANVRRTWAHAQTPPEVGGEEASKSHEVGGSIPS